MSKEVVIISDLGASSGGNFRGNRYSWGSIFILLPYFVYIAHCTNSLVKAFVWGKTFAHGKIKRGRKSLVKKKNNNRLRKERKSINLWRKEKNFLCESNRYWGSSTLASRFWIKKSLLNQNLPYIMWLKKISFSFIQVPALIQKH